MTKETSNITPKIHKDGSYIIKVTTSYDDEDDSICYQSGKKVVYDILPEALAKKVNQIATAKYKKEFTK